MNRGGSLEKSTISVDAVLKFRRVLSDFKTQTNLSNEQILLLLENQQDTVPVTIFNNKLGILESLVKYLKEEYGFNFAKIAEILKRDARTIWSTYEKARKKHPARLFFSKTEYNIPIKIFSLRKLGVLETLVTHLKNKGLKYSQISRLIGRDQRTVWTVYRRALSK